MHALPTGTVTFFFTDIEGSTRLSESTANLARDLLPQDADLRDLRCEWTPSNFGSPPITRWAMRSGCA
jgi:hypothetical protein